MQNTRTESKTAAVGQLALHRRKLPARSAIAGAIVLALAATHLTLSSQAAASLTPPVSGGSSAFAEAPSFAQVAALVTPAVVNVTVTQSGTTFGDAGLQVPQLPDGSPFGELFQRFFHEGSPLAQGFKVPRQTQGQGSGFIIDPEGHIVTNNHVIENAAEVEVALNDSSRYKARVVGRDSRTDLALLKIDAGGPLPYVELGNSDQAQVGDWVLAVGNPFGLGGSVSAGIISARGRDINSGPYDDFLQIDAPINRGNSGGPLFDASGRVIGINTAIYTPSGGNVGIGFAIPSDAVEKVIAALKAHGRVERGWFGVETQPVTEGIAAALGRKDQHGALLAGVIPEGPAARAGLKAGDLILSVDDKPIKEVRDLSRTVAEIQPGTRVKVGIQRQAEEMRLDLTTGEMPGEEELASAPAPDVKDTEPRLGVFLAPLTEETREARGLDEGTTGVLVARVERGSAAERAGIRPGALITMVGQVEVSTPDQAASSVREAISNGEEVLLLRVEQDGEARFVAVEPAA
jgi:serine protease Do